MDVSNVVAELVLCCPPITMVMAQTQHDIRIVPGDGQMRTRSGNVPSGTVVDDSRVLSASPPEATIDPNPIVDQTRLFSDTSKQGFSFFIVPHGGLKVRNDRDGVLTS